MWTEARRRGFTLGEIARWMAEEPAKLAGFQKRKGKIEAGHDADFVVFDPEAEFVLGVERLHYRHRVSPYLGEKLAGIVRETYVRGQCVFSEGKFSGEPSGKEYRL
jgi:allantoinase